MEGERYLAAKLGPALDCAAPCSWGGLIGGGGGALTTGPGGLKDSISPAPPPAESPDERPKLGRPKLPRFS